MRKKLLTLLLAVAASVGTMFAWDYERVQIGDLYYNLDATNHTAEVTYKSYTNYEYNEGWGITTANIPASATYSDVAYSVTSIGDWAFYNCSSLTSVTIPNSVTNIGSGAFYECRGLTSVTIPNSVTSIGNYAFGGCSGLPVENNIRYADTYLVQVVDKSLSTYIIKEGTKWIESYAFYNCSGLTSMEIPNSVTSIGKEAFTGCSGLTSVIWNAKNYADFASNNTPFYANYYDEERHQYIQFDLRPQITSFTFGNEVEHIPAYLCNGMSNLTSVTIGNSVTSIGSNAFDGCRGLPVENNIRYADTYLVEVVDKSLSTYIIKEGTKWIGSSAFQSCSGLTSMEIPNSVTSIGSSAFSGCSGLTSVTIPNSVTSIGKEAFFGCTGLTSVEAPAGFFDIPEGSWPYYTKILNHVTVNGGELTENALLLINRSYKTLQTLDVSGVTNTEFADEAFKGYYNLQQLVLPAGLQKVSYMMVAGCKNLQSINIPASVEEIEQSAFEDCRSIQTITFGGAPAGAPGRFNAPATSASQLRRIGNWAFYNAHELQNLEIPEGVEEIDDRAFYGCTYLEEMVLPSSIQAIGDNCFALCAKLTKITCNAITPPTIKAKTFFDVKRQIPVYVPDEAVSAYEGDTYWQEFDIQGQSDTPQGVEKVQNDQVPCTKVIRNGQIFILRGDKTYTLQGQEVK